MKKLLLFFAALCLVACNGNDPVGGSTSKGDYVDLGLTSGTKWKVVNELNPQDSEHGFYTYDEAVSAFGENLPTKEQWMELVNECTWKWTGMGYKVIGSNGNSIILPAAGYHDDFYDAVTRVGQVGRYWSSNPAGSQSAWALSLGADNIGVGSYTRIAGYSVRLVK